MFFFQVLWLPEFGIRLNLRWFVEKAFRDMESYFINRFVIRYIPHCSYRVQLEQPELVNRYMTDFLMDGENCD
ncbi:MAG TPA: hypothetical protein PKJ85_14025 [Nitrosomonas nitrosa]|nr:hypothetical protein [Nitrosomonas nitrosa]